MTSSTETDSPLRQPVAAAYGLAEMGMTGTEVLVRIGLLIFYTDHVGLDPRLAGYAIAIAVIWDALTDPLMGRISDRTRSRFGRRIPYIFLGGLLLAAATVTMFSPPELATQTGKFTFLLFSYMAFNTAMTVIAIPHAALGGDLTRDPARRNQLFGWRMLAGNLGMLAGTVLPAVFLRPGTGGATAAERAAADHKTSLVLAALTVITSLITVVTLRSHDRRPDSGTAVKEQGFAASLRHALGNRPLWPLLAAYLVATLGMTVNSAMALYYYRYRLALEENATRTILGFFMLVFCLAIPGWIILARRFGKKALLIGGIAGLGAMTCVAYPLFPPGMITWPLAAGLLGGILVGSVVLLDASLADVADYDQVFSGESRQGLYFGFWKLCGKTARALALAVSGHLLAWIGFVPNQPQSADTSWKMALIFGPGVGVFFLAGAALASAYPLDENLNAKIRRILAKRQARIRS